MNDYAIEILSIELYKWKSIYNEADREMCKSPNEYSNRALIESDCKIKSLESAINLLKTKTE